MFPQMTAQLRAEMYDEARLFFESIVRENQSIIRFVDGDYTYLNGTLAPIYGLEKTVTKGFGWIAGDVKRPSPGLRCNGSC